MPKRRGKRANATCTGSPGPGTGDAEDSRSSVAENTDVSMVSNASSTTRKRKKHRTSCTGSKNMKLEDQQKMAAAKKFHKFKRDHLTGLLLDLLIQKAMKEEFGTKPRGG